ncbi:A/G-specific adenine glycosylase [bacterium]|nr:A/G-specific adenine glycosylase [bacterium]
MLHLCVWQVRLYFDGVKIGTKEGSAHAGYSQTGNPFVLCCYAPDPLCISRRNDCLQPSELSTFRQSLLQWYHSTARDLPWRRTRDPYRIWLSEIMLQQTRVAAVIDYYNRFLEELPTVGTLAAAELQTVLKLWEGLGYYRRSRLLHKAAGVIVEEHSGQFPQTFESLKQLPGIGDYTAAAIASIAFGEPVAVVDGNVKRVIARLKQYNKPVNTNAGYKDLKNIADHLLEQESPGDWNQAVMELGARICRPKRPLCESCPAHQNCEAYRENRTSAYPIIKKKEAVPHKTGVAILQRFGDSVLFTRRGEDEMLGGLWEFPIRLLKEEETLRDAVRRLAQAYDLPVPRSSEPIAVIAHEYTHFKLTIYLFEGNEARELSSLPSDTHRLLPLHQSGELPMHRAQHKLMEALQNTQQALKF